MMGSLIEDLTALAQQADQAGRPAPPQVDEIDEDATTMAFFVTGGQQAEAPPSEVIEVEEKGSASSGHYRHRGRPGQVGGSTPTPGGPPPDAPAAQGQPEEGPGAEVTGPQPQPAQAVEARPPTEAELAWQELMDESEYEVSIETYQEAWDAAQGKMADSTPVEPGITELVTGIVTEHGGKMEGLDFRLKSVKSMTRKIIGDMIEKGYDADTAASRINDAIRYTSLFDPETYSETILKIQDEMKKQGWTQFNHKWKNFWHPGGTYSGYHSIFTNADGRTFEWQFHTPESLRVKKISHKIYEQARLLPDSQEKTELMDQMVALWAELKDLPRDYHTLPGVPL